MAFCFLGYGCGPATTWSTKVLSPNGDWLATAESQQWGGPGNDWDATTVYLRQVNSQLPPIEIFSVSHYFATIHMKMEWVTPTHLKVTYAPLKPGDQVGTNFRAIKCGDIAISVRELTIAEFHANQ